MNSKIQKITDGSSSALTYQRLQLTQKVALLFRYPLVCYVNEYFNDQLDQGCASKTVHSYFGIDRPLVGNRNAIGRLQ